jgi:putative NADPH-quinone reductase
MTKRILVILGQPDRKSFGGALAQAYIDGAREGGAEVREIYLGEIKFDPAPIGKPGAMEPDLVQAQESIKWAEHLVFIYPIWWGTIPALLKGFIERTFSPGFAVNFRGRLWDKLLKGRSARLIVTLNTPSFIYRWVFGAPGHKTMKSTILKFSGVSPVRISDIAPVAGSTDAQRALWLEQVRALGRRGV